MPFVFRRGRAVLLLSVIPTVWGCGGDREMGSGAGPWDHLLAPGPGEFLQVSSYDTTGGNRDRFEIAPGDSAVLLDVAGPGVVRRLWITVSSRDPHYLRRIALKMYWDGEPSPSVAVPLGDFFGNGFRKVHYTALPMGVSSGGFYSYLPMPFHRRARIVAENGTGQVVDAFYFNAGVETEVDLPNTLATFHARWNRDPRTVQDRAHTVLEVQGTGHLVGLSLNADSYDDSFGFLEGDESFWIDGEFRGQGTGTEDYFNGGWYFQDGPFSAPYHGVVMMEPDQGRVAAYRWHLPDPVRFRDSVRVELEHGHANEALVDLATVAYWYQVEPHASFHPLPPPDERRVLEVQVPAEAVVMGSPEAVWNETRRELTLAVPRPDRYRVWVYPRGSDGRPRSPHLLRDQVSAVEESISLSFPASEPVPYALYPEPLPRWPGEWMVAGPFPNPQRVGTEYSSALDSTFAPETNPDRAGFILSDGRTVSWHSVSPDSTGYVRLNPHFQPSDWVAAYAKALLYSPRSGGAFLLLGADDAHELWVNGELVSSRQGRNISTADDLEVPVNLREGWNRVLLKVADLDGGWGFHLRAADPRAEIRWSAWTTQDHRLESGMQGDSPGTLLPGAEGGPE